MGKRSTYRQVQTSYWQDSFVMELTPEEKFFYVYLLTNTRTNQCGLYELPQQLVAAETGYNRETIDKLLKRFVEYGKICYSRKSKEILIKNWMKYNFINSPKVIGCINECLKGVKDKDLLVEFHKVCSEEGLPVQALFNGIACPMDRVSIPWGEEREREREREEEDIDVKNTDESSIVDNVDNSEPLSPVPGDDAAPEKKSSSKSIPYQDVMSLYNNICTSLPGAIKLTDARKRKIKKLYKELETLEEFRRLFNMAEASDFLSGRSGKWTGCSFDWILDAGNALKVLEGVYNNKQSKGGITDSFNNFQQRPFDSELEKKLLGW